MPNRQGKHRDDKHRVQAYYKAEQKALMVLVAKIEGSTLTDTLIAAISDRAKAIGILDGDGKVTAEYREEMDIQTQLIKQAEERRTGK